MLKQTKTKSIEGDTDLSRLSPVVEREEFRRFMMKLSTLKRDMLCVKRAKSENKIGFTESPCLSPNLEVLKQNNQVNGSTQEPRLSVTFCAFK